MSDIETAYNSALDYLYSFVDYSLKHSSELAKADFNLDRMRALMVELGNPEAKYPIIHVAGTKGKGSVSALCASALQAAGHIKLACILRRTYWITPSGFKSMVSRFRIKAWWIWSNKSNRRWRRFPNSQLLKSRPRLAFYILLNKKWTRQSSKLDLAVGSMRPMSSCPKFRSSLRLSYDHMAVLGNTLALIAGEKAGIIKPGVPVVSAPQKDEALEVLVRIAKERNAPFTLVGRDITYKPLKSFAGWTDFTRFQICILNIPLLGIHQIENAATAYAALKASGLKISDEQIRKGFAEVKWPARFEVVRRDPPVIFDSAHNQDSFVRLCQALDDYFPNKPVYLIFGASEDKNIPGMFAEIQPKVKKMFVTRADHPRALEPEKIIELARQAEIPNEAAASVEAAFARALDLSEKDGSIVLSAGSMFVTAEVMMAWKKLKMSLRGAVAARWQSHHE